MTLHIIKVPFDSSWDAAIAIFIFPPVTFLISVCHKRKSDLEPNSQRLQMNA